MINNRSSGSRRSRSRSGSRPQGGGQPQSSSRIDSRARGNAPQLLEKYKSLARDAQMQGDRVMTEYYLQFADHYFRVVSESRQRYEEQRGRRDDYQDGYQGQNREFDDGFEDGFEGEFANEPRQDDRSYQPRDDRSQGQPRGDDRSQHQPRRDDGQQRYAREPDGRQPQSGGGDERPDRQQSPQRQPQPQGRPSYSSQRRDSGYVNGHGEPMPPREQGDRGDQRSPTAAAPVDEAAPFAGSETSRPATSSQPEATGRRPRGRPPRADSESRASGSASGEARIDAAALPPAFAEEAAPAAEGAARAPRRPRAQRSEPAVEGVPTGDVAAA